MSDRNGQIATVLDTPGGKGLPTKVQVEWIVENDSLVTVLCGTFRTVLHLRAIRDTWVSFLKVDVPTLLTAPNAAEAWIAVSKVPAVAGKRALKVQRLGGQSRVVGCQDLPGADCHLDAELAWHLKAPKDYWLWANSPGIHLAKGECLAVTLTGNIDLRATVRIGGNA